MFTIKFIRQNGEMDSLSAARYTTAEQEQVTSDHKPKTFIYIYPSLKLENGVCVALCLEEDEETYHEMFVENMAGKTIDRHRARSGPEEALSS